MLNRPVFLALRCKSVTNVLSAVLLWLTFAPRADAQMTARSSAPNTLQAVGEYAHRFDNLVALRELSDGSLLVIDRGDRQVLWIATPEAPPVQLGRKGEGPNEYMAPRALVALGKDSTVLTDAQLLRWYLLVGRTFKTVVPWSRDVPRSVSAALVNVDKNGRAYWLSNIITEKSKRAPISSRADSMALQRISIKGGPTDTIARLRSRHGFPRMVARKVMGVESWYELIEPMRMPDQLAPCTDGWLAIAHVEGRRIEWLGPDGRTMISKEISRPTVKVTESMKRDAMDRLMSPQVAKYFQPSDFPSFPEVAPAFQKDGLHCTYDGRALIERYDLLTKPVVYDVVSRDGTVGAPLTFPPRSKVVGQSSAYIYVVTPDEDDLQILRRYRWR